MRFIKQTIYKILTVILFFVSITGCEKVLDIGEPEILVTKDLIFSSDITATSAVIGIYAKMMDRVNFASGSGQGLAAKAGLSADDYANFNPANVEAIQFMQNKLVPDNSEVLGIWTTCYSTIYQANAVIESLINSTAISPSVRDHLLGEALFIRSFCHFNLVNLFGEVPLVITTDYKLNTIAQRINLDIIYDQIISDLSEAETLMSINYPSEDRVRPNKLTATAMLARVHLYRGDWAQAEAHATEVIINSMYGLETDLNRVFLSSSTEAIWQLKQTFQQLNTWEGNDFIVTSVPGYSYLTEDLISSFELEDLRATNWIGSITTNLQTFHYPLKYKIKSGGPASPTPIPISEYSVVFRLAEQLLIRAEARARLNNLTNAIADIDIIRARAGLSLLADINPGIAKDDLLLAIEQERRNELFTEWGHRWFDLKRTGRATEVLTDKPDLEDHDLLYPIPSSEFAKNPKLGRQNDGY